MYYNCPKSNANRWSPVKENTEKKDTFIDIKCTWASNCEHLTVCTRLGYYPLHICIVTAETVDSYFYSRDSSLREVYGSFKQNLYFKLNQNHYLINGLCSCGWPQSQPITLIFCIVYRQVLTTTCNHLSIKKVNFETIF